MPYPSSHSACVSDWRVRRLNECEVRCVRFVQDFIVSPAPVETFTQPGLRDPLQISGSEWRRQAILSRRVSRSSLLSAPMRHSAIMRWTKCDFTHCLVQFSLPAL